MLEELEEMREDRIKMSCCHPKTVNQKDIEAATEQTITDHTSIGWSLISEGLPSNVLQKVKDRLLAEELSKAQKKLRGFDSRWCHWNVSLT
jgi:hypothetical protein